MPSQRAAAESFTQAFSAPSRRSFLFRRLHSLSGVVPVGAFLLEHLWTNANGLFGQARFDRAVAEIGRLPLLPLIEIFGIFLPLAFHALYGVKLAFEGHPNVVRYPHTRNWMYTLQRASGLVAFAFIGFHLWEFRVAKLLGKLEPDVFYPTLTLHLSSTAGGVPWLSLVYLVGVAACVFHFANGLFGFTCTWGIAVSRRSQRLFATAFAVFGALVFVLGETTVLYFATGARFGLPPGTDASSTWSRCSVVDP